MSAETFLKKVLKAKSLKYKEALFTDVKPSHYNDDYACAVIAKATHGTKGVELSSPLQVIIFFDGIDFNIKSNTTTGTWLASGNQSELTLIPEVKEKCQVIDLDAIRNERPANV